MIPKLTEVSRGMDQSQGELFFKIKFKKIIGCMGENNGVLGIGVHFTESTVAEVQKGPMIRQNNVSWVRLIDIQNPLFLLHPQ